MDPKGLRLAELIEAKIGYGQIAALKVAVDGTTGKARGTYGRRRGARIG